MVQVSSLYDKLLLNIQILEDKWLHKIVCAVKNHSK